MPTLNGEFPIRPGELKPCIWCQAPTDVTFMPEAMPQLGPQPMHMTCAMDLLLTFEAFRARRRLPAAKADRIERLQRLALTYTHGDRPS